MNNLKHIFFASMLMASMTAAAQETYQVRSEGMLHIAYLYNHDMGYNVLLPDLYGHGESEGDIAAMARREKA